VAAVGADQVNGVGAGGAGVGAGEDGQEVFVGGEFAGADGFLAGAGVDQEPAARGVCGGAAVAADEDGAAAEFGAELG
jgi:hypothetical protein